MRFGFMIVPGVLCGVLAVAGFACRKAGVDVAEATPLEETLPSTRVPLDGPPAIHHAAREMALDGFQFGKSHLAWPFDSNTRSAAAYFETLVREGYLEQKNAGGFSGVEISNLSDSDPGETAFLRVRQDGGKILIVRKDGMEEVFSTKESASQFAPPPPREPEWLP